MVRPAFGLRPGTVKGPGLFVQPLQRVIILRCPFVLQRARVDRSESRRIHFQNFSGNRFIGSPVMHGRLYSDDRTGLRLEAEQVQCRAVGRLDADRADDDLDIADGDQSRLSETANLCKIRTLGAPVLIPTRLRRAVCSSRPAPRG